MRNLKPVIFSLVVLALLASCGQQPQTIVVQAPPQNQTTIVNQVAPQPQVLVPVPVPVPVMRSGCGMLRESRLVPGMYVRVSRHPDLPNVLRREPTKLSEYLGALNVGGRAYLLDGPYCDRGTYLYWRVRVIDKDNIYNKVYKKQNWVYDSVYTAETDIDGLEWLVP